MLPLPLKEIAVEHFKVTTSWPLPRGQLLLPDYDPDRDGLLADSDRDGTPDGPIGADQPADLATLPIVPLDGQPHLTFGRTVHDDALVGVNSQPVLPTAQPPGWERIGDPARNEGPARVRYGLKEVTLERRNGGAWVVEARKAAIRDPGPPVRWKVDPNPDGVRDLYGSWAPVPQLPAGDVSPGSDPPVANVKLWLWSKTPFDYTRHGGRAWDEWFTDRFSTYPCVPVPPDRETCFDVEHLAPSSELTSPWAHPDHGGLRFTWGSPATQTVTTLGVPIQGRHQALCFPSTVTLPGGAVIPNEITIDLPQPVKAVRLVVQDIEGVRVTGETAAGQSVGPVYGGKPGDPDLVVAGAGLTRVIIHGFTEACLVAVCFTVGLDDADRLQRQEMAQHLIDEMARWSQTGEVLAPHTTYRLKVVTTLEVQGEGELSGYAPPVFEQTEFAYFRTAGPPGLTVHSKPLGHPNPAEFRSGLEDLKCYVRQTVPATIPAAGRQPSLPRPVYRAYDVGVEFSENYVDLLYRLERRDLGLYLYDSNNRAVRDAQGRLIVLSNRWGATETLTLTESETRWIAVVNASGCAALDITCIPHDKTLTSAAEGQVLDPDCVYEARLVPLLLHEDFGAQAVGTTANGPAGTLAGWRVADQGANSGPSRWTIGAAGTPPSRHVEQTTNIWGGTLDPADPVKPGTLLLRADNPSLLAGHPDQPGNWTDYRLSVLVCSSDDDAVGVVFRYLDANHYYRFSMDRQRQYRRLVRVVQGVHTILAEDDFVYRQGQDYLITVEVIAASLRVYQDGALVFNVSDDSIDHGRIGFYCWGNIGARFSDVRVDDFRLGAPVVYRFQFTTSRYANFFHQLHSFQDETWPVELTAGKVTDADLAALVALGVRPDTTPTEAEARAYETLAGHVLGAAARQDVASLDVTRVERGGAAIALLIRSPEPVDWRRTSLEVQLAPRQGPRPELPGSVKLTDVSFGTLQPNEESVTLLLREVTDLTRHRLEYRRLPGPLAEPAGDPILFLDDFDGDDGGLLFREAFGPNALDHYTIVDEGQYLGPSAWAVTGGQIVQTSNLYGGRISRAAADKPGTLALTGAADWTNVRVSARLRSDDDAIGVLFRYQDADHYYRFSMDRERGYRRLIRRDGPTVSVLWEDDVTYNLGQSYELVIEAYGDQLLGYLDETLLFSVRDAAIRAGRVGLYCWANTGARFEALAVEALQAPPVLWQPVFADLSEVEIADEAGTIEGPSTWSVRRGMLRQWSNIHDLDPSPHQPGTYALGGSPNWWDVQISVRLRSDNDDAIGVLFRYQDGDNYYRFSMDCRLGYRRLIKKAGGVVTVLWQDAVASYVAGHSYELTLRAVGSELRGFLDGTPIFAVYDGDLKHGRIGLYCWANPGARFERVLVADRTRRIGRWTIHDEGTVGAPSIWHLSNGALRQTADIAGGSAADPARPGTQAVTGGLNWTDYRLTVQLRSDDDDAVGLVFRYRDDDNYYRLSVDAKHNRLRLIVKESGAITVLWEEVGGYPIGGPFTLTVDAIGRRLRGYLGDRRLFTAHNDAHSAGQVGLYCSANAGARFERVEVRYPPLEARALLSDRFAAGDTSGWSFVDEGTEAGPSAWSTFDGALRQTSDIYTPPDDRDTLGKPGTQAIAGDPAWSDVVVSARLRSLDDDAIGVLFRYQDGDNYYRFSMDRERGYRRLVKNVAGVFSLLWEDDVAYEAGRAYELTIVAIGSMIRGHLDGVPMFAVEDGDLAAGRIGLYCWANHDAQFSDVRVYPADLAFTDWLLDEPFELLISDRWTFVDEGDQQGPSHWQVTDSELRQTSNLYGGSTDGAVPEKPGTQALAGDPGWRDYRLSVQLRSDDDDAIGVLFRYQDSGNYYRFSMDRERGYRRLIKKIGGVVTVLWEADGQYDVGREYLLTVDCVGERLTGYLDGVPLFTAEDGDLAAGRIGLYCWANTGARFAEVRVAAPDWLPYYTFEREARQPAGTRVRVSGGNRLDAPPAEAGLVRRFSASLDQPGRLRLPPVGADLRVRAPAATSGHARHFLPDSDYSPVDVRVLRRADGTGLAVLVPSATPAGSQLVPGQYRLRLTYRRDNRAADPTSQVLSEEGSCSPEDVTIDIPW